MAINSKSEICNLAISFLGSYASIIDIDTPTSDPESVMALWYDIARQVTLKTLMPNFALSRRIVAKLPDAPVFGYAYAYEYPADCLKILGIDNVQYKNDDNYCIEEGTIQIDIDSDDGLKIRFIKDVETVSSFSAEFKIMFAQILAKFTALAITKDTNKRLALEKSEPLMMASVGALNSQENKPVRKSVSKFRIARTFDVSSNPQNR